MSSRYKPNWTHLRQLAGVTVRELALASVDRNPDFLKVVPISPNRGDDYEAWQAYESRLEVVVQRLDEMRRMKINYYGGEFSLVNLSEFSHWCRWQGWNIPPEMEDLASEFRNPGKVDPAGWMRYRVWFLNNATLIVHDIDPNSTWGEYLKWVFNLESISWIKDPSVLKIHRDYHALVSHFDFATARGQVPWAVLEAAQKAGFNNLKPFINALPADESDKLMQESERKSLLKIIRGLAEMCGYDPADDRNGLTGEKGKGSNRSLSAFLDEKDITISSRNVRTHINKAYTRYPGTKVKTK